MSLDTNRKDFEKALDDLNGTIESISFVLDGDIVATMEKVSTEYSHYESDIDILIGENKELQDKIDELER